MCISLWRSKTSFWCSVWKSICWWKACVTNYSIVYFVKSYWYELLYTVSVYIPIHMLCIQIFLASVWCYYSPVSEYMINFCIVFVLYVCCLFDTVGFWWLNVLYQCFVFKSYPFSSRNFGKWFPSYLYSSKKLVNLPLL